MSHTLDRCILEVDDRPMGLLIRQGDKYEFHASDPDADLLNGTVYENPEEALAVVRAHVWWPTAGAA
ncbi:MAG: hypothetical protein LDL44_01815 [Caenispirillum sp.]|nr:hypothetical protein [Caenispirillum sp.]